MIERLCYVYGVVGSSLQSSTAPTGIDDGPVRVESLTADVDWVSQRAMAHDRVLTWASDNGAVIPFPMWTLFRDAKAVKGMLGKRMKELKTTFARIRDGREFIVRVYVQPGVLKEHLGDHSTELKSLETEAARSSPG